MTAPALCDLDRKIIDKLQHGFPLCPRPYAAAAATLGLCEEELLTRLSNLLEQKTLSRFGPLFDAERMGGAVTLAAISVPGERFEEVTELVNRYPEVAHNYERDHKFNMWFVLASDRPSHISEVLAEIEAESGLAVVNLPKEEEYFLELKLKL